MGKSCGPSSRAVLAEYAGEVERCAGTAYCHDMVSLLGGRSSWAGFAAVLLFAFTGSLAYANVAPQKVFYLQLKVGQCAKRPHGKILLVVPCSDPTHALETYAVLHGGWGATPPSGAAARNLATSLCRSSFQRRFGHPIPTGYGFEYFFPDPGAETTKYHDRVNCSLRLWPAYGPMGAGTHHG
jgi:hypothetical protein